jgi:hypothetical protein
MYRGWPAHPPCVAGIPCGLCLSHHVGRSRVAEEVWCPWPPLVVLLGLASRRCWLLRLVREQFGVALLGRRPLIVSAPANAPEVEGAQGRQSEADHRDGNFASCPGKVLDEVYCAGTHRKHSFSESQVTGTYMCSPRFPSLPAQSSSRYHMPLRFGPVRHRPVTSPMGRVRPSELTAHPSSCRQQA